MSVTKLFHTCKSSNILSSLLLPHEYTTWCSETEDIPFRNNNAAVQDTMNPNLVSIRDDPPPYVLQLFKAIAKRWLKMNFKYELENSSNLNKCKKQGDICKFP